MSDVTNIADVGLFAGDACSTTYTISVTVML